ncbi:MAG: MerR family transcriptional regulator [Acidimicrobiales bacterium]
MAANKVSGNLDNRRQSVDRAGMSGAARPGIGMAAAGDAAGMDSVSTEEVAGVALEGFRGPQVCRLVGITYRQLDYWARTGLLTPSVAPARGSGTQRLYSYGDVLEIKVVKRLLDAGVSLKAARKAVECLRDAIGESLPSATLVMAGDSSILAHSSDEVVDLLRGGQGVFSMIPMEGVVSELEADISTLPVNISHDMPIDTPSTAATSVGKYAHATSGGSAGGNHSTADAAGSAARRESGASYRHVRGA